MILGRLVIGYCKKDRMLEYLAKIFGYVASAPLTVTKGYMKTKTHCKH